MRVRLEIRHDPRVPADVVLSDPAPPVEEEGRTRHCYYRSPQDCRWDTQRSITGVREMIESQGHVVDDIRLAVLRTSGQPSEEQLARDRMRSARMRPLGDDVDVLWWSQAVGTVFVDVIMPNAEAGPSWPDARAAADGLTAWYRHRLSDADDGQWATVVEMLALALWRVAVDQQVPVADAVLDGAVFGYLRNPDRLVGQPLPHELSTPVEVSNARDPVLRRADRVMSANYTQYSPGHGLGPTADGQPDCFTVADRLREIAQDPEGLLPLPEFERVRQYTAAAGTALHRRQWLPTEDERAVAMAAHEAIKVYPSKPVDDDVFGRSWLARLRRLAQARDTVQTLDPVGTSPLGDVLVAIVGLLDAVTEPLPQLEAAWSAHPAGQRIPVWERAWVPLGVRSLVHDTEHELFMTAATLAACITGDVDY
jgi:hypothetical protein